PGDGGDDAAERIAGAARLVDARVHLLGAGGVRAAHRVLLHRLARDRRGVDGRLERVHLRHPGDDVHRPPLGEDLARDRARGDASDRLARAGAAAGLPGADAVLGLVGVVRVRRAVLGAHLLVVAAARVLVAHQERDGRAERQAVVHAREDLDAILLAPLGDDLALAGAAPVELALHVVGRQRDPRRTAV